MKYKNSRKQIVKWLDEICNYGRIIGTPEAFEQLKRDLLAKETKVDNKCKKCWENKSTVYNCEVVGHKPKTTLKEIEPLEKGLPYFPESGIVLDQIIKESSETRDKVNQLVTAYNQLIKK